MNFGEIGFTPVDTGSLSDGRKQEPGSRDAGRYALIRGAVWMRR
jgi:predicted dinucleotide-binding enzyme